MKLLSYKIAENQTHQIGVLQDEMICNLNVFFGDISLIELIQIEDYQSQIESFINSQDTVKHDLKDIVFLPPIPKPNSFRDAYAFKEHVETCRANRGADMIPEFSEFPVFYFSNHNAMYGHEENIELTKRIDQETDKLQSTNPKTPEKAPAKEKKGLKKIH